MIVARIESTRNSYEIVKASNLKRILDHINNVYDEDYLKSVKMLKVTQSNLNKARSIDLI